MKKISVIVSIIIINLACTVQNEFMVSKPGNEPGYSQKRFIYVLPQTVLKVHVELLKEIYIPGPYRRFAPTYLGISDIKDGLSETWKLRSVKIDYFTEPDSAHYYSLNLISGNPDFSDFLNLSNQGLVVDPSKWMQHVSEPGKYPSSPRTPYFTDLSVTDFFMEITDTLYKTIITDTSLVEIPIPRRQRLPKTIEQKAEEAALFILHLRETRFDLLSGEFDTFPGGVAMEFAINELNRLEKQYLELFTGKVVSQLFTGTLFITPEGSPQQFNLISLLMKNNLPEMEAYQDEPVILQITPLQKTHSLPNLPVIEQSGNMNHLIYRIPDMAVIKVTKGRRIYYEERASLYQAGKLVYLPILN